MEADIDADLLSDGGTASAPCSVCTLMLTNHLFVAVRFTVAVLGMPLSGRCSTILICPSLESTSLPFCFFPSWRISKLLWYCLKVRLS